MGARRQRSGWGRLAGRGAVSARAFIQSVSARAVWIATNGAHGAEFRHDGHRAGHRYLFGVGAIRVTLDRVMVQRQGRERAGVGFESGTCCT